MKDNIAFRVKRGHLLSTILLSLLGGTCFIFSSFPERGFAQVPVPEKVKDTVAFLFTSTLDGKKVGIGTGFFVKHEGKNSPTYLVTAKHVLISDSKNYCPKLCLKLNNTKGGAELLPIDLSGPTAARVFVHDTDPDVDIAVIPLSDIEPLPGQAIAHYPGISLSVSLLATKDHFSKGFIQEGDETFFAGWFMHYYGITRNYPIMRFGRLALLTDEKIPWNDEQGNRMLNLYLIETHASMGVSGSPIFFRPSPWREPRTFRLDTPTLLLAGVLKGYLSDESSRNAGIAAVVPAFQLQDILFSEEVKNSHTSRKQNYPPQTVDVERCRQVDRHVSELFQEGRPKP